MSGLKKAQPAEFDERDVATSKLDLELSAVVGSAK
jgi:hypothetical protein